MKSKQETKTAVETENGSELPTPPLFLQKRRRRNYSFTRKKGRRSLSRVNYHRPFSCTKMGYGVTSSELRFHPVGQGLFSSGYLYQGGQRPSFAWIYDCGSSSYSDGVWHGIHKVGSAIRREGGIPTLDLLVLSHFDADHISGVTRLLSVLRVETLLIPLIPLWQRLFLLFDTDKYVSKAITKFFLDPVASLLELAGGRVQRIVLVAPSIDGESPSTVDSDDQGNAPSGNESDDATGSSLRLSTNAVHGSEVESKIPPTLLSRVLTLPPGGRLTYRNLWEFVPYNDGLSAAKVDSAFVEKAEAYRDILMDSTVSSRRKAALKRLKRHYEQRFKGAAQRNRISLFLYAGPIQSASCGAFVGCTDYPCVTCMSAKGAVLYTGDGYLDRATKWHLLEAYLSRERVNQLHTLQVMHHGSRENWYPGLARAIAPDYAIFSGDPTFKFKHPNAEVVSDFRESCNMPCGVVKVNRPGLDQYHWFSHTRRTNGDGGS